MKGTTLYFTAGMVIGASAVVVALLLGRAAPAFSATLTNLVAAGTPTPEPGNVIPLKSIEGLSSLSATVNVNVNGLINGQRAQGDLTAVVTTNDQGKSKITVSGGLLGQIAAQVGGSLVGLFTPSTVDIYKVPEGTYVVVNGLFPVCVKPEAARATASVEEMSPQRLLGMLTSSDVARGRLVGQETRNGIPVKHYLIDGVTFLAAAQASSDPDLRSFGEALWSAEDADLYVDAKGGYPVAYSGSFTGEYEPLQFEGDFDVQIELTGVNTNPPVALPSSCNRPISA
jgi:hypothetical protein